MICANNEKNISGQRFGKLTAIKRNFDYGKPGIYWVFDCDCGETPTIRKSIVTRGVQWTCGCHKKEMLIATRTTHGLWYHELYMTWAKMIARCNNPLEANYKNYGGRGIKVCDRWLVLGNFIEDMSDRPKGMSIDRIDNNGNYEPSNCRWATPTIQSNNRRKNSTPIVINGVSYTSRAAAARSMGMSPSTLRNRIARNGLTSATRPVMSHNAKYDVGDGIKMTLKEISGITGITTSSVSRRIKKGYTGSALLSRSMRPKG